MNEWEGQAGQVLVRMRNKSTGVSLLGVDAETIGKPLSTFMQTTLRSPIPRRDALPRVHFPSLNFDWRYALKGQRDLRLDCLRGFAVFAMIVDHLGSSSWLHPVTGGNHFFVSAAEGFVFISGLLVGIIYGDLVRQQGLWAATRKALARAWCLYKLTVPLSLLFVWWVFAANLPYASWYSIDDPRQLVWDVLTLRRTFVFVDIPLLYTMLLLAAPIALALMSRGQTKIVLVASGLLWLAYQIFPSQLQQWPWAIEGNWVFHIAAWQLVFVVAMAIGYHRKRLAALSAGLRTFSYLAVLTILLLALIALYTVDYSQWPNLIPGMKTTELMSWLFDKSSLGPGRLLAAAIVFQFAYLALTLLWRPLYAGLGWLFNPLGQNSLYSYTLHVFLICAFYTLTPYLPDYTAAEMTLNTVLQLLAVLLTWQMIRRHFLFRIIPR